MPKRKPNEEIFRDGDNHIRLVADFGFMSAVNSYGRDVSMVFTDLSNALMPPLDIKNVLVCAAVDIPDGEREAFVEDLINRYGLQECAIMARVMLSHAMLGDVKKSSMDRAEAIQGLMDQFINTPSASIKKVGLLWVAMCLSSTALVCLIFNLNGTLI